MQDGYSKIIEIQLPQGRGDAGGMPLSLRVSGVKKILQTITNLLNLLNFKPRLLSLLLILSSISPLQLFSQKDSACTLEISLLTCSPGDELYSTFGHTAIRVRDTAFDIVFNYGTFDFDDPNFLMKFVRGRLPYSLSVEYYTDFRNAYYHEKRGIKEQLLQISCAEKEAIFEALKLNGQEQNRYYKYQFLLDNCTTRAREIIRKNTLTPVVFKNILPEKKPTFRNLIHEYLDSGKHYWSKLGIDLLLGSRIDRKVTNEEAMFLPDYLLKGFDSASINSKTLATPASVLLEAPSITPESPIKPEWVFTGLLLLLLILSLVKNKITSRILSVFDRIFFVLLGLLGGLFLFMWFGTDHQDCAANYNLIWALPIHLVVTFFSWKRPAVKMYFHFISIISTLLLVSWFFIPQQLNIAIAPILGIIILRSYFISKA